MISEQQAFAAISIYLNDIWCRTKSSDLGVILGDMALLPDGSPADPAVTKDWKRALEKAQGGESAGRLELS